MVPLLLMQKEDFDRDFNLKKLILIADLIFGFNFDLVIDTLKMVS